MPEEFRPQYRPIDPDELARRTAGQPRLLAIEVAEVDDDAEQVRSACRVVDLVSGAEVTHIAAEAPHGAGELLAVARGVAAALKIDPTARLVVRGSAELVQRLRVEELADAAAVTAVAHKSDNEPPSLG